MSEVREKYKEHLLDIFPHFSQQQIEEIIDVVLNEEQDSDFNSCLELMISYLVESGDSTLESSEATGVSTSQGINRHIIDLQNIFPNVDSGFLATFCAENSGLDMDMLIDKLITIDLPIKKPDPLQIWEHLSQILPNADPIYLRNNARILASRSKQELQQFIENCIKMSNYPTMQEYLQDKEKFKFFTNTFNVEEYLKEVPDPLEAFLNNQRNSTLLKEEVDVQFALTFLYNQHPYHRKTEITKIFNAYHHNISKTNTKLKNTFKALRNPRSEIPQDLTSKNVVLLQEILFVKYEKNIRQFIKTKSEVYCQALQAATQAGLLQTCNCCYNDELIPEEVIFCDKKCSFCKDCVKRGTESAIGDGKLIFPCFSLNCNGEFSYATLQMILEQKVFQRLFQRKQYDEIKKANIDGLESCPFCDFSMIPMEDDKIFKCQNVDCMKETCRECGHLAHIPLRCSEIEYDEDVRTRTFIETKMTEALLRQCWNCSKKFYIDSGCNKITCPCGALMCYLCGKAIKDYSHFKEYNGTCALWTEHLTEFHQNQVLDGASAAKIELGIDRDPSKLKFDPTKDFHF